MGLPVGVALTVTVTSVSWSPSVGPKFAMILVANDQSRESSVPREDCRFRQLCRCRVVGVIGSMSMAVS